MNKEKSSMKSSIFEQLTPHFNLYEFVASKTAYRKKISNIPSEEVVENIRALCVNVLEHLSRACGHPVYISSGYRCPELNKAVGGVPNSQHIKGEAADIKGESKFINWVFGNYIKKNLPFDQLIFEKCDDNGYPSWIHVSYRRNEKLNRKQIIYTKL